MSRIRNGRHAVGYVGVLCLLGVAVFHGAPLILSAAAPARRSVYPYPGWSLGQPLLPRAADLLDRIRPRRPARSATASPSVPNDALHFDGIDDRVTFGAAPSLGVTTWFRRDGPGASATTGSGGIIAVPLVTKGMAEADGDNRDTNYFLGIDGKRRVLAADFEDTVNGGNHPAVGVTPICDGIWYHAAASYDGTTWRLYLNGNLEAQVVVGAFTPRFDSIQHAALGTALNSSGNAGGAFMGALDEVRIWNVVRNASDIQANMTAPLASGAGLIARWGLDEGAGTAIVDSTGNGNAGTLLNGVSWTTGTPFVSTPLPAGNYGVHLKGTTGAADYVSFGTASSLGTPTFTVETWFMRDGTGVTTSTGTGGLTSVVPLVSKGRNDGEGNTLDINYFLGLSGSVLVADFEEGATGTSPGLNHPLTGVTPILNNVWYHGAVTYDGTTLELYLNGVLEGAMVVGQPPRSDRFRAELDGYGFRIFRGGARRSAHLELRAHGGADRKRQRSRDRRRQRPAGPVELQRVLRPGARFVGAHPERDDVRLELDVGGRWTPDGHGECRSGRRCGPRSDDYASCHRALGRNDN